MYFSGPVMTYRTGFSPIVSPLKYIRFFKVREKKLMYFSGSLNMKILVLKVISDPLKYTSLIH